MDRIEVLVAAAEAGMRVDRFVSENCGISRAVAQRLLERGHVLVNGRQPLKSYSLQAQDLVQVSLPEPETGLPVPQDIPLDVVFEDARLLVVNKPKGMVVHPAAGNQEGTLVNALLYRYGDALSHVGGEARPGIVHRIDKDTSGLLVVAKDDAAHEALTRQFAQHSITREYQAVVYGVFRDTQGEIDAPIGRSPADRKKMAVVEKNGKRAVTGYEVLAAYHGFSHLRLRLQTGRTHQIRVHMASIGHPLAGDVVYGPKKPIRELRGQCLHAATIGFVHPETMRYCEFNSVLPDYFMTFLQKLEREAML